MTGKLRKQPVAEKSILTYLYICFVLGTTWYLFLIRSESVSSVEAEEITGWKQRM
jgi:hypothetical protein